MRLIQKKIKEKNWFQGFAKKASAIALASTITFGSIFGLSGCGIHNNDSKEPETSTTENQELISSLTGVIESLNTIISNLYAENEELVTKLATIEQQLKDAQNDKENQEKVVADLTALVAELQQEVETLKNELDSYKNSTEKEEMEALNNELAKLNAQLAISHSFDNNYMQTAFKIAEEDFEMVSAPNGDLVASRGKYEDYAYWNKDQRISYQSNEGEESFYIVTEQEVGEMYEYQSHCINLLKDTNAVLDKMQSTADKYVFKAEDGSSITIEFKSGELVSFESSDIQISKSTQERFEQLLIECKSHLKMIGLYEAFKKDVDASLNYQYKGMTGSSNKVGDATGVFSEKLVASETKLNDGTIYDLQSNEKQYTCKVNENGELVQEWEYDGEPYDMTQNFKENCLMMYGDNLYTISQNEQTGAYVIVSRNDQKNGICITTEIEFNDDLSVDVKQVLDHNDEEVETEIITYHVEKITKAQFDEMYNRILAIVHDVKENQTGVTIE